MSLRQIGNIEGRNLLFELEVACKVKQQGHAIIDFDDVQYLCNGVKINVQCKRLHSEGATRRNVNKAVEQYQRRAITDQQLKGVIALSVEKITNTDGSIFECHSREQINRELTGLPNPSLLITRRSGLPFITKVLSL